MRFSKIQTAKFRALLGLCFMAVFSLSACSKVDWAVRFADTYLSWKLNNQFDFSGDSKRTVKKEVTSYVRKMRQEQLPRVSQALSQSADELETLPLTSAPMVKKWVDLKLTESEKLVNTLLKEAEPFAFRIVDEVDQDNWESFLENFQEDTEKITKKPNRCAEKFEDNLDDWLGNLNPSQKGAIEKYCEQRGDALETRAQNRTQLLMNFRNSLGSEDESAFNKEAFQTAAKDWLKNYQSFQSLDSQNQVKKNRGLLAEALTQILMQASDKQKEKFILTLKEKSRSLQRLTL